MCVIHPFCLKYVRVKELKTDFHIPYATEFYLYASIRKPGKIITKNVRHVQMVKKKNQNHCFGAGFQIKPKFYFRYQRPGSSEIYLPKTHSTSMDV